MNDNDVLVERLANIATKIDRGFAAVEADIRGLRSEVAAGAGRTTQLEIQHAVLRADHDRVTRALDESAAAQAKAALDTAACAARATQLEVQVSVLHRAQDEVTAALNRLSVDAAAARVRFALLAALGTAALSIGVSAASHLFLK